MKTPLLTLMCICLTLTFFAQAPVVTSFSPLKGGVGDEITITGSNFSADSSGNIVRFGATIAEVTSASATSLKVKVPYAALYAPISVNVNDGFGRMAYSLLPFNVTSGDNSDISGSSTTISVGNTPIHLKTADFDNDGLTDIVVVNNASNTISILRNKGDGSFDKTDYG